MREIYMKLTKLSMIAFMTFMLLTGSVLVADAQKKSGEVSVEQNDIIDKQEKQLNGWIKEHDFWHYYKDGEELRSQWLFEDGKWYYLNDNGVMISGHSDIVNGVCYYFEADGSMTNRSGWIEGSYAWYYGNGDGTVKSSEWLCLDGTWYYLDMYGVMLDGGTYNVNGVNYRFEESGAMSTKYGWIKGNDHDFVLYPEDQAWLYGNGDGTLKSNEWIFENGHWYFIDGDGYMVYDSLVNINGYYYYFNPNGVMETKKGWLEITKRVISDDWGVVAEQEAWVYLNGDGTLKSNEWIFENSVWYFIDENGYMVCDDVININGYYYYFKANGVMETKNGWLRVTERILDYRWEVLEEYEVWIYVNEDGTLKSNEWISENGNWYYVGDDSYMVSDSSLEIGGKNYNFDKSGVCLNPYI